MPRRAAPSRRITFANGDTGHVEYYRDLYTAYHHASQSLVQRGWNTGSRSKPAFRPVETAGDPALFPFTYTETKAARLKREAFEADTANRLADTYKVEYHRPAPPIGKPQTGVIRDAADEIVATWRFLGGCCSQCDWESATHHGICGFPEEVPACVTGGARLNDRRWPNELAA